MSKRDFIPNSDEKFDLQLQTFKNVIGSYATLLGVTAAQVTSQAADADFFHYVLLCLSIMRKESTQWVHFKDGLRDGLAVQVSGAPVLPVFPTAVSPVLWGIEARFRALVALIKRNTNYNESIGHALGIEGVEEILADLSTIQPVLDLTISGNAVSINWGWLGHGDQLDMLRLEVDRGDGKGFVFLAMDTTPGYIDTTPFPAAPAKMDLPRHLLCEGSAGRPMEQVGQRHGRSVTLPAVRASSATLP